MSVCWVCLTVDLCYARLAIFVLLKAVKKALDQQGDEVGFVCCTHFSKYGRTLNFSTFLYSLEVAKC